MKRDSEEGIVFGLDKQSLLRALYALVSKESMCLTGRVDNTGIHVNRDRVDGEFIVIESSSSLSVVCVLIVMA